MDGQTADFSRFRRVADGQCELLAARFSRQSFGRHAHERYALGAICAGVEKLYYRGASYLGTAGTLVTISPGEIHDGLPGSDQGWMYRMLYVDPQWLNRVVLQGHYGDDHLHLFREAFSRDEVFAQAFARQHALIEVADSLLERDSLLLGLLAALFQRGGVRLERALAAEREAVRRVRGLLDEAFARNVALDELAALVGMDPLYMIRVFKKSVGVSPHSYQIQKRVAHVQQLLRQGMAIADASFCAGFFDQSHMARAFRKVVGVTPGRFRDSG
ncbi:AraC family transcriptional regulator [Pseudomonas sp. SDI]|uniref:helix-turn-helix domain-containing protein n=1 Tax=Pseudomonas sp. SDI TaxID=2170734 RepID=UPI000DE5F0F2|nr:AraC family transcriptional regulator [Pseudomonas sp. SDI]PWB32873.1 AraC family transcriptional regulator [Pseudomonas sp. SDI]